MEHRRITHLLLCRSCRPSPNHRARTISRKSIPDAFLNAQCSFEFAPPPAQKTKKHPLCEWVFPRLVENRRIELLPNMLTHVPHGALPPIGGIIKMPVTPEAVIRISPDCNSNRIIAIYSNQEIPSPDTLLVRSSLLLQHVKKLEAMKTPNFFWWKIGGSNS